MNVVDVLPYNANKWNILIFSSLVRNLIWYFWTFMYILNETSEEKIERKCRRIEDKNADLIGVLPSIDNTNSMNEWIIFHLYQ